MGGRFDLSRLCQDWLHKGFELDTNLSRVGGPRLNPLIDSMNQYSARILNKRIIELVMLDNHMAFNGYGTIPRIIASDNRVVRAFTIMGNYNVDCTVRWLIITLNRLEEFKPLSDILGTAVPSIILRSPLRRIVLPGESIEFQVRTISEAQIQWRKYSYGSVLVVKNHISVDRGSMAIVSYEIKKSDFGSFGIHVQCKGDIHEFSPMVDTSILETPETVPYPVALHQDGIKRVALLIGIMDYEGDILTAPESDIFNLEEVLLSIGFSVFCFGELNGLQMKRILNSFSDSHIEENSYIFFYFAGHGKYIDQMDHLLTRDFEKIRVASVLETLASRKPKVLITIFDMCRSSDEKPSPIIVAKLPIQNNLITVMSTLPMKEAYETSEKFDNSSLIIKPLCKCLSQSACKSPINLVLVNFLNSCENIDQKPIISNPGIPNIIGKNINMKRIELKYEWIEKPENLKIVNHLVIDFKIFHNILNILIFRIPRVEIEIFHAHSRDRAMWVTETIPRGIRSSINLFCLKNKLSNKNELSIVLLIREEGEAEKYHNVKIIFPQEIIDLL